MKNCRTSTRKPYTLRRGAISAFAQDAPRTARPLRRQVGMKNCRTSTRKPYTLRHGTISAFAQDAPRTARPLRRQVGMKNCRTSTRKPYTIRRGAISAIKKRDSWEMCLRRISLPQKPWLIENKRQFMGLPLFALSFTPAFWSSPKMPLKAPLIIQHNIIKGYARVHF